MAWVPACSEVLAPMGSQSKNPTENIRSIVSGSCGCAAGACGGAAGACGVAGACGGAAGACGVADGGAGGCWAASVPNMAHNIANQNAHDNAHDIAHDHGGQNLPISFTVSSFPSA